ncbi:MAG: YtxH domain-containing protein [Candidatus Pseudobacter hemicellulosilyticus]|uniref:YtxH domain-containing protein n=1 Tax=Candidatus Pseudobacter hemicellulosilyticus TaxID=3121375 RepID=A0AAJ5WRT4_9BACT|nr:MAG: YtxH domain-containing protein [Pseudobacter sp.]
MSTQKVILGTLTGVLAGVAIGLLAAPASGAETRQKIADSAGSLKRKFNKLIGVTSDELDELKDVFQEEVAGLKDDVRERVLELIKAAKASGSAIKEKTLS